MEQVLTTFGIDWKILLFQSINFSLVLLVLWRFLFRPLSRIIAKRQDTIEKGLKSAAAAEVLKSETEMERSSVIAKAGKEAERLLEEGRKNAEVAAAAVLAEAVSRDQRMMADAKARAENDRMQLMEESKQEMARMAILAAERILRKQISK